jgi:hypothetical protein
MKKKMGFDIHGVTDDKPEFFGALMHTLMLANWEVHIITGGSLVDGSIEAELKEMNIPYTHIFSVYDHLVDTGAKTNEELGIASKWPFPDEAWNKVKSEYCAEHGIDMHIDDMPEYLTHFTTPYMLYRNKDRNHRGQYGKDS